MRPSSLAWLTSAPLWLGCALSGPAASEAAVRGARSGVGGRPAFSKKVVAAYLPDYRLSTFKPEMAEGLTDLILFSVQPGADGRVRDDHGLLGHLEVLAGARRSKALRVLLSVGGGGPHRSKGFSAAASDPALRARLVGELVGLAVRHGFDGLDLDWEHLKGPADARAFTALAADLKRALEPHRLLLTAAVGELDLLEPSAARALDRVHLMTYDGLRHGAFTQAEDRVRQALARGIPPHKLCLGIPLYARGASPGQELAWEKLVARYRPAGDADEVAGYRFSGVETTRAKARFVRRQDLGGVMFWELSQDSSELSLIRAAREALGGDTERSTSSGPAGG